VSDQAPENWRHKDLWHRRGQNFLVEISRHTVSSEFSDEGPNRWAVYAYIYPAHPHFPAFSGPAIFQDATGILRLHRGCSYLEYPMYDGKVTSVKVGSDYHHLRDDHFTYYDTPADAYQVFADADELFEQLHNMDASTKATETN
jgi:hypothetical protein